MTGQNEWDSFYLQSSSLLSAWIGKSFHPERGEMLTYMKLLVSFFTKLELGRTAGSHSLLRTFAL